jgi:aminoglycoside 6'-N-acetyltransferase I
MNATDAIRVRPATRADSAAWVEMRAALWPSETEPNEHADEIAQFFAGTLREPAAVLIAVNGADTPLGFAELSIRTYAEDCETDHVAYLEGWYVKDTARRRGVGRALVEAAERWGREQGCSEFASDALLDNEVSAAAHRALGFTQTVELRCFRKDLPGGGGGRPDRAPNASDGTRRNLVLLLAAMVGTFVLLRLWLVVTPNADFNVAGYNIHHLFTGLLVVTACAIPLALDRAGGRLRDAFTAGLGVGLGMTLDEWVYLIATDGTNASYLLPVSFWGGVVVVGIAAVYAIAWAVRRR